MPVDYYLLVVTDLPAHRNTFWARALAPWRRADSSGFVFRPEPVLYDINAQTIYTDIWNDDGEQT